MAGKSKPGWLIACALLPLAACGEPQPTGQVVAVVDGTELTRRELREELPEGLRGSVEQQGPAVNHALEALIDRKLLAERAREMGLETDPEYHFALRQAREQLLVEALRRRMASEQGDPSRAEIDAFIAARPWQFARRSQFVLTPADDNAAGLPVLIDSAEFGDREPGWAQSARVGTSLESGGTKWRISAIYPLGVPIMEQQRIARESLRSLRGEQSMEQTLGMLRSGAVIRYQPGFGPSGR